MFVTELMRIAVLFVALPCKLLKPTQHTSYSWCSVLVVSDRLVVLLCSITIAAAHIAGHILVSKTAVLCYPTIVYQTMSYCYLYI